MVRRLSFQPIRTLSRPPSLSRAVRPASLALIDDEADLIAAQACVLELNLTAIYGRRALDGLVCLRKVQVEATAVPLAHRPATLHLRRNDPEVDVATVGCLVPIGLPVTQVEGMGDDPRAGFQLAKDARPEIHVDLGQEIHAENRRIPDLGVVQVLHAKLDLILDARLPCVLPSLRDPLRIDIDSEGAGPVLLGSGDSDAPVARSKVDQVVVGSHLGHFEHLVDDRLRGRHIDDVELRFLCERHP